VLGIPVQWRLFRYDPIKIVHANRTQWFKFATVILASLHLSVKSFLNGTLSVQIFNEKMVLHSKKLNSVEKSTFFYSIPHLKGLRTRGKWRGLARWGLDRRESSYSSGRSKILWKQIHATSKQSNRYVSTIILTPFSLNFSIFLPTAISPIAGVSVTGVFISNDRMPGSKRVPKQRRFS